MMKATLLLLLCLPSTILAFSTSTSSSSSSSTSHLQSLLPPLEANFQRLFLIRHGSTEWNRLGKYQGSATDLPLNSMGQQQAQQVASALQDIPLDAIVSSPLQRARQTAQAIQQHHPIDHTTIPNLKEMNFGIFEGRIVRGPHAVDVAEFRDYMEHLRLHPSVAIPEGESFQQVQDRLLQAMDQIISQTNVAVVAHGRANKILLAALLPKESVVPQDNAGLTVVDRCRTTGTCRSILINYTHHLERQVAVVV